MNGRALLLYAEDFVGLYRKRRLVIVIASVALYLAATATLQAQGVRLFAGSDKKGRTVGGLVAALRSKGSNVLIVQAVQVRGS